MKHLALPLSHRPSAPQDQRLAYGVRTMNMNEIDQIKSIPLLFKRPVQCPFCHHGLSERYVRCRAFVDPAYKGRKAKKKDPGATAYRYIIRKAFYCGYCHVYYGNTAATSRGDFRFSTFLIDNLSLERTRYYMQAGIDVSSDKNAAHANTSEPAKEPTQIFAQGIHPLRQKMLSQCPSGEFLIPIRLADTNEETVYVITAEKSDRDDKKHNLHYTEALARELLTAAYHASRNRRGSWNGEEFEVTEDVFPKAPDSLRQWMPTDILIKKYGGYGHYIMNQREELVDLLMYSPKTQRYECCHATCIKATGICYMDGSVYRMFLHNYGNPKVKPYYNEADRSSYWSDLNEESLPKAFGYSVSKAEGLSDGQRIDILTDLVDAGIMDIPRIIDFLNWLLDNPVHKSLVEACDKWEHDIRYLKNYKARPERFLLSNTDLSKIK